MTKKTKNKSKKEESVKPKEPTEVDIFRVACGISGIVVHQPTADHILQIVAKMKEKGDQFSVHDSTDIEYAIERKYAPKKEIVAMPAEAMIKENKALREGLRLAVEYLTSPEVVKINKKAVTLVEDFVVSVDTLLQKA
jgi:hypothetical protein